MSDSMKSKVTMGMLFYVAQNVVKTVVGEPIDEVTQERIDNIIFNRIITKANESLVKPAGV